MHEALYASFRSAMPYIYENSSLDLEDKRGARCADEH